MLRTKQINNIINDCDYYKNEISRQEYSTPLTISSKDMYNNDDKCQKLEELSYNNYPIRRRDERSDIYLHKNMRPMTEYFDIYQNNNDNNNLIFIIIALIAYFFVYLYNI
jgi:hypothetical protein